MKTRDFQKTVSLNSLNVFHSRTLPSGDMFSQLEMQGESCRRASVFSAQEAAYDAEITLWTLLCFLYSTLKIADEAASFLCRCQYCIHLYIFTIVRSE